MKNKIILLVVVIIIVVVSIFYMAKREEMVDSAIENIYRSEIADNNLIATSFIFSVENNKYDKFKTDYGHDINDETFLKHIESVKNCVSQKKAKINVNVNNDLGFILINLVGCNTIKLEVIRIDGKWKVQSITINKKEK